MHEITLKNVRAERSRAKQLARQLVPRLLRNWLRSPSASLRWAWDSAKYYCGIKETVEMRPGWKLICHPAAYRCAYFAQKSDPDQVAEFDCFIGNCSKGMTLFDVGAHFGLFSLAALHYGGPSARAIAVDPSPTAVQVLGVQAKLNNCSSRLEIVEASINDGGAWQNMVAVGVLASGYYVAPAPDQPASEISQIKSKTLDGLVAELDVVPTHLKIDVEGYEAAVLTGGQKLLSQPDGPVIFIEIHNAIVRELGEDPVETLKLLRGYGYETYTSEGIVISDDAILSKPLIRIVASRALSHDGAERAAPNIRSENLN